MVTKSFVFGYEDSLIAKHIRILLFDINSTDLLRSFVRLTVQHCVQLIRKIRTVHLVRQLISINACCTELNEGRCRYRYTTSNGVVSVKTS